MIEHKYPIKAIEDAVKSFKAFPGIGEKSALRMVVYLLKQKEEVILNLSKTLEDLSQEINYCKQCNHICQNDLCVVCLDKNRNQETICVVKDFQDLMQIENTGQYNGLYHVLGGLISPLDGIGPEELAIDLLQKRIQEKDIKPEIILALSATVDGDTTAFYLGKILEKYAVKITTIARGIAMGGELEYADEITLAKSILSRVPLE